MVRYIFPENEEIAKQNQRRHGSKYQTFNYIPKENKENKTKVEDNKINKNELNNS